MKLAMAEAMALIPDAAAAADEDMITLMMVNAMAMA